MKLTKQNIKIIDNFLKRKGVVHWDIRLEMIDHLASKIEQENINFSIDYLQKDLPYWKISKVKQQQLRFVNVKYNKLFKAEFIRFIKHPINLVILLLYVLLQIWIYKFGFKKLLLFNLYFLYTPLVLPLFFAIRNWIIGNRSYNLEMIFTRWIGTGSFLYIIMMLYKKSLIPEQITVILLIITSIFLLIKYVIGFKLYKKTLKNYTSIFSEYKTL